MSRSFWWCKLGDTLKRSTAINGQPCSSSAATRYFLFNLQYPNVVRVNSMFFFCSSSTGNSCSSSSISDSDSAFVVSYLINSCGLSENKAITVSKKIKLKTLSQPDSVLKLLENHGFTKPYISKLITKQPSILLSDPHQTLKPTLDFFNSKGLRGIDLADFISRNPQVLTLNLETKIIPLFDVLRSIVHTNKKVIKIIKDSNVNKLMMVNSELFGCEVVPQPRSLSGDADKFKKVVEKVKGIGFDPFQGLPTMCEATLKTKVDVYNRWGWSEDHIQAAFRKSPWCMMVSEKKITAIMDFLVNEMGYDSLSIAETPMILTNSLEDRIIPRCSVIRVLVSKGLIKEKISLNTISSKVDKYFLDRFVKPYEQQAPELMTVFQGRI